MFNVATTYPNQCVGMVATFGKSIAQQDQKGVDQIEAVCCPTEVYEILVRQDFRQPI